MQKVLQWIADEIIKITHINPERNIKGQKSLYPIVIERKEKLFYKKKIKELIIDWEKPDLRTYSENQAISRVNG